MSDQTPNSNWWDAYPAFKSSAPLFTGGHVRGSSQWHAQTFYDNLPKFFEQHHNTEKVVFYCGSSMGRGPRCAGWYQDYLNETGTTTSTAYILQGGIKAWLEKYADDENLVDKD
ncbi:hypothetical protein L208DRAFT_1412881 [Tricholoma matsutake]|nr:hypothetical protein L208DRAFT_1417891 [Tricholoma matsutake 945]KAF8222785.1 hypothetical protein L208DRAFT_1412881 [Tricholoma matsutake 945]